MTEQTAATAATNTLGVVDEEKYDHLLEIMQTSFVKNTTGKKLFTTNCGDLFSQFLELLPADRRQYYTCNACKTFMRRYGGLVSIDEKGVARSVVWDLNGVDVPEFFKQIVVELEKTVNNSPVTGVFLSSEKVWGQPKTGDWTHFAVVPDKNLVFKHALLKSSQMMAEKEQDLSTLKTAISEFSLDVVKKAEALLNTDSLYRSEKCLGVATWFKTLLEKLESTKNETFKNNIMWLHVAEAPPGFCHVRSTMIGTLLEDLNSSLPFEDVSKKFAAKMNPLKYMRPTAAPSDGQIAQANKIVTELKSAGALDRRFAKLEDLQLIWRPKQNDQQEDKKGEGVFDYLKGGKKNDAQVLDAPPKVMTWTKFANDVLPTAEEIEYLITGASTNYSAFVTAANSDSPPILQWDKEEQRNQVSWYVYHGGSYPNRWNLPNSGYVKVTGVALQPSMWDFAYPLPHHGKSVTFVLEGAKDTNTSSHGGFFVEMLRNEYHTIRATLEAHMMRSDVAGRDEATACGIRLQDGHTWNHVFRVTCGGVKVDYKLDRWE